MLDLRRFGAVVAIALASCATSNTPFSVAGRLSQPAGGVASRKAMLYEPLAAGAQWKYTCRDIKGGGENGGNPFTIEDRVIGPTMVNGVKVYEFSRQAPQVPSNPLKIVTNVMLLHNDAQGNLWIYGYRNGKTIRTVHPTKIVFDPAPANGTKFTYPGPAGAPVKVFFFGIVPTNPTPLGTFTVADYEESGNTHDYGYAKGLGIAEEDHGPNFEVDCLIESFHL